jgi:hypothetical protein
MSCSLFNIFINEIMATVDVFDNRTPLSVPSMGGASLGPCVEDDIVLIVRLTSAIQLVMDKVGIKANL